MYPTILTIGNFTITSFGLMMFLAFVTAAFITGRQLERYGMPKELAWDVLAWVAIGGILGAKFYYLALHWGDLLADPVDQLLSRGGLVWYGGMFGGIIAYWFQVRAKKLPSPLMFDGASAGAAAGYGVGRMGCFLVGDDYGRYTTSWIGVAFPRGTPPSTAGNMRAWGEAVPASIPDSAVVSVHPTQLYEVALASIMFAILWRLGRSRRLKTGQLFAIFLGMYAVERFFIEIVRAKSDRFVGPFSTSQLASIALLIAAAVLWWHQARKGRPAPLTPAAAQPAAVPVAQARSRA